MSKTNLISICILTLMGLSCGRHQCKNTDAVFDRYSPFSKEYKAELVRKISMVDRDQLNYWISERKVQDGRTYMVVDVEGDGLCAKGVIDITYVPQTSSLKAFQESTKGGYNGAQLSGLKYKIVNTDGVFDLYFVSVVAVVD